MTDLDMELFFQSLYGLNASKLPSKHTVQAWLHAQSPASRVLCSTSSTGKWCIFRSAQDVDAMWQRIENACTSQQLDVAKVSTHKTSQYRDSHVICVYTPDFEDKDDVRRVREILRELGCIEELGYKRDVDTRNGVYGAEDEWTYRI